MPANIIVSAKYRHEIISKILIFLFDNMPQKHKHNIPDTNIKTKSSNINKEKLSLYSASYVFAF